MPRPKGSTNKPKIGDRIAPGSLRNVGATVPVKDETGQTIGTAIVGQDEDGAITATIDLTTEREPDLEREAEGETAVGAPSAPLTRSLDNRATHNGICSVCGWWHNQGQVHVHGRG